MLLIKKQKKQNLTGCLEHIISDMNCKIMEALSLEGFFLAISYILRFVNFGLPW